MTDTFDASIQIEDIEGAANSVIENYSVNENSLRHVSFEQIVEEKGMFSWPEFRKSILCPILVFLNNGNEQDIYEALDDYLNAKGNATPLDLLEEVPTLPEHTARILLRNVLVPSVLMRGPMWASNPEEQRDIRTKILKALFTISERDQEFAINELSQIEHSRKIEQAYKSIEGPKFSIDFASQNQTLARLLQSSFERYLEYRTYEQQGGQLLSENSLLEKAQGNTDSKPNRQAETSEVLLSNIAFVCIAEYIWNPVFGVNATLATRIRHGSLENQFMRELGAHSLVTTKDASGNFQCSDLIKNTLSSLDDHQRGEIVRALIAFNENINTIYCSLLSRLRFKVPEAVVNHYSQTAPISDLGSEDGLLDLCPAFGPTTFEQLRECEPKNIQDCLGRIHSIFSSHLGAALTKTRSYIGGVVSQEVDASFDALDQAVAQTLPEGRERSFLRKQISEGKVSFPNDLRVILQWFTVAQEAANTMNNVADIFSTASRVVQFASNGRLGTTQPEIPRNESLPRDEALALYEVLSILFRNIVQHACSISNQQVRFSYNIREDNTREISVSNLMPDALVCDAAVKQANSKLSGPLDARALDRHPGGTGLRRVRALLSPFSKQAVSLTPSKGISDSEFKVLIYY